MENDTKKFKTPQERTAELREQFAGRLGSGGSLLDRLKNIGEKTANEETNDKGLGGKKGPLNLAELTKKERLLGEEVKREGIDIKAPTSKDLEGKNKNNDKTKDDKDKGKDKDDKDKENTPEKQEKKMKEMFSKVKLPSGMELHQEGPQWVLVSKDGKQRTDVTDVMNTIDKFNRDVDAANEENRMHNETQSGVDKAKDEGLQINDTNGKVQMVGEALPAVKDVNGEQLFKPEDIQAIAETGIRASIEQGTLEKLKDSHSLEEMRNRERKNEDSAEKARDDAQQMALRRHDRGGR